jgi:hypothetical protein
MPRHGHTRQRISKIDLQCTLPTHGSFLAFMHPLTLLPHCPAEKHKCGTEQQHARGFRHRRRKAVRGGPVPITPAASGGRVLDVNGSQVRAVAATVSAGAHEIEIRSRDGTDTVRD